MNIEERLFNLKSKINEMEADLNQAIGAFKIVEKEMKDKGYKVVKELEEAIEKESSKLVKLEASILTIIESLEKEIM